MTERTKYRLLVALYRLAVKECEEEWIEKNITLYHVKFLRSMYNLEDNLNSNPNFKFEKIAEFSSHIEVGKNWLSNPLYKGHSNPLWIEIEFLNQAGIVSTDRLYDNYAGRYIIFPEKFAVINHSLTNITNKSVLFIKMKGERSKERKIVDMIWKLHELITNFPELFLYYN